MNITESDSNRFCKYIWDFKKMILEARGDAKRPQ